MPCESKHRGLVRQSEQSGNGYRQHISIRNKINNKRKNEKKILTQSHL
jgi:hypothetical protein